MQKVLKLPTPDFRTLFDAVPGLFLVLLPDAPQYTIVAASDEYLRVTMTVREEILGKPIFEVFPDNPDDPEATGMRNLSASLQRVINSRAPDPMAVQKYDIRQRPHEGGVFIERWWSPVNSPVFGPDGELQYIIHRVEDITEFVNLRKAGAAQQKLSDELRFRAEKAEAEIFQRAQELQELNRRLNAANRQLANAHEEITRLYEKIKELDRLKSHFFANVSHELRTPLQLIIGPTERVLEFSETNEAQRRELEIVVQNARTLARQVEDLLDVAKLEAGRMEIEYADTDLADLVRFVAGHFESLAREKGIHFGVRAPERVNAQVDPEKFQRVMLNLLSNAYKFTPAGGCIGVTLRDSDNGRVILEVSDSGPGIPADRREAVFERFRQLEVSANRRFGGTGLGLAIAREFVDLHGGSIRLTSAPGDGALFVVELPRLGPPEAKVRPRVADPQDRIGARRADRTVEDLRSHAIADFPMRRSTDPLVLVVEDNPEMSRFIAVGLADRYRVAAAFDGKEGLAKAIDLKPDVILVDIMMPAMSGGELIGAIRKRPELASTPVMLVSAKADDELRVKLLREGAQDYITKPFSMPELRARVDNLVAKKQVEQALRDAQRMRDEWFSIIAHDLRQPVSVIALSTQALPRILPENIPDKAAQLLERIARGAFALDRMVSDLVDVSRLEARQLSLEKSEVDIVHLITDVVERTPEAARRCSVHRDTRAPGERMVVLADAGRLEQVLGNLLSNAVKYGEPGTAIDVTVSAGDRDVEVCVMNQGKGILPSDLPRVFERFRRAADARKQAVDGLGIGLYLAKGLVEAHGGRIWAESIPGDVTSFHLTLPRAHVSASASASADND